MNAIAAVVIIDSATDYRITLDSIYSQKESFDEVYVLSSITDMSMQDYFKVVDWKNDLVTILKKISSDYIYIIKAPDYLEKDFVEKMKKITESNNNVGLILFGRIHDYVKVRELTPKAEWNIFSTSTILTEKCFANSFLYIAREIEGLMVLNYLNRLYNTEFVLNNIDNCILDFLAPDNIFSMKSFLHCNSILAINSSYCHHGYFRTITLNQYIEKLYSFYNETLYLISNWGLLSNLYTDFFGVLAQYIIITLDKICITGGYSNQNIFKEFEQLINSDIFRHVYIFCNDCVFDILKCIRKVLALNISDGKTATIKPSDYKSYIIKLYDRGYTTLSQIILYEDILRKSNTFNVDMIEQGQYKKLVITKGTRNSLINLIGPNMRQDDFDVLLSKFVEIKTMNPQCISILAFQVMIFLLSGNSEEVDNILAFVEKSNNKNTFFLLCAELCNICQYDDISRQFILSIFDNY